MAIDWKSPENTERLLTCVYAWLQESGVTINHHIIAKYFGNGATYDAVQGNFRKFKQRIEKVKEEAGGQGEGEGAAPATTSRGKGKKGKNSSGDGVLSGRVGKGASKKVRAKKVKVEEELDEEEGGEMDGGV